MGKLARDALDDLSAEHSLETSADVIDVSIGLSGLNILISQLRCGASDQIPLIQNADIELDIPWIDVVSANWNPSRISITGAKLTALESSAKDNWSRIYSLVENFETNEDDTRLNGLYEISNSNLSFINTESGYNVLLALDAKLQPNNTQDNTQLTINGTINNQPLSLELAGKISTITNIASTAVNLKIQAEIAESTVKGQLLLQPNDDENLSKLSSNLTVRNSVKSDKSVSGLQLPQLELSIETDIIESGIEIHTIQLDTDRSDLSVTGDITGTLFDPITFNVQSDSNNWHTSEFALPAWLSTTTQPISTSTHNENLFSKETPGWHTWLQKVSGEFTLHIDNLYTRGAPSVAMHVNAQINEHNLKSKISITNTENSSLKGQLDYSLSDNGDASGSTKFELNNMRIEEIPFLSDVSELIPTGSLVAEGELWFSGKTPADMASQLYGDVYLLIEQGELDSMAVEAVGIDIMEITRLLFVRDLQQVDIRCAYANVNANSGVITLENFLVDSDDTFFSAKGGIDLNSETIDLVLTPKPHDASLFSAVTPIHVKGSLTQPAIRPGKRLYLKLASAAALATVTGPFATIIPFISFGKGEPSENCTELLSAYK